MPLRRALPLRAAAVPGGGDHARRPRGPRGALHCAAGRERGDAMIAQAHPSSSAREMPRPRAQHKLLAASGISKSFWRHGGLLQGRIENRALDGVSLDLAPGDILGLVGESGCGKSTFAKVLLGLEAADAGELDIDGAPMFAPGMRTLPAAQRGIQMVFQDPYGSL